jgi:selenide,water dikinase
MRTTDITGFGFIGHAWEMVKASARMRIYIKASFYGGRKVLCRKRSLPGGAYDNFEYYQDRVKFSGELNDWEKMLLFDPQTSGGLLAAVEEEQYLKRLSTMTLTSFGRSVK